MADLVKGAASAWDKHREMMRRYSRGVPGKSGGGSGGGAGGASAALSDVDVLRKEFRFISHDAEYATSWGKKLVEAYCRRLYKEYALVNLARYTEGKVGMRWRTEDEVVDGKGQFTCGGLPACATPSHGLATLEVPFAYKEGGEKREALVKLRLCRMCRYKLEFKRNEKKRLKGLIAHNDPPPPPAPPRREGPPAPPAKRPRVESEEEVAVASAGRDANGTSVGTAPAAAASAAAASTEDDPELNADVDRFFKEMFP